MDKDIKEKWLEALKSGKYQKGERHLRTLDDKFCCLGVLCDLISDEEWKRNDNDGDYSCMDNSAYLAKKIIDIANISRMDSEKLVDINDNSPSGTFKEVVDYIEEKL